MLLFWRRQKDVQDVDQDVLESDNQLIDDLGPFLLSGTGSMAEIMGWMLQRQIFLHSTSSCIHTDWIRKHRFRFQFFLPA